MSDVPVPGPADSAEPSDGITAGMMLRRAREAAGLHVATLAVALKVPVRKLEALEEDRYDQLSDVVFVRALASSVCRTLKIDPQPVLDRLPQNGRPRLLHAGEGINAPFRAPGEGPSPGLLDQVTRPAGLVVVGLLLAALVIVFLPSVQREQAQAARSEAAAPTNAPTQVVAKAESVGAPVASAAVMTSIAASASVAPVAPSIAPPIATTASSALPTAPVIMASATALPALRAASTLASSPMAVAASGAVPVPDAGASGIVVFRASAPSWVQVTDARGTPVLRQLLQAGDTAGASGALPLSVTVGSAQSTQVQVRGKPFDLAAATRDNVARFEVK